MDKFIVSARKYRPATFDTVIGQKGLTTTLKNSIKENKLAHAYLFCGPRGVGKTTCARIFAKAINCEHLTADGEACNECESCRSFNEGRSYNIHELDAASNNSVEDIRSLIEQVRIPPQIGKYKVFIIDEVHMLSTQAFNAFLKTLEEPPAYAKFILATTERHKVLPTIVSRCQVYDFYRISINDIVEHLSNVAKKEGVEAETEALTVIAQKADGGMRDALSLFDQMVSYSQGKLTYKNVIDNLNILDYEYFFRFTDLFLENKTADCMLLFNEILQRGFDGGNFIGSLASHFRDLLVSKEPITESLLDVSNDMLNKYKQQASRCSQKFLFRAIKLCNDCDFNYRESKNKRLLVELTLIQLSQLTEEGEDVPDAGRRPAQIKPIFETASAAASPELSNNSTQSAPQHASAPQPSPNSTKPERDSSKPTEQSASIQTPIQELQKPSIQTISKPVFNNTTSTGAFSPNVSRMGTVSIRTKRSTNITKTVGETKPTEGTNTAIPSEKEEKAFTNEELEVAWRSFAKSLPKEEIALARRLEGLSPKLSDDGVSFTVVASNKLMEGDLKNARKRIVDFLRDSLHNSKVDMSIELQETHESERMLTRPEQFRIMVEQNPSLQLLTDLLDLDLV
ncbi:MAG: DNA polymerase III subunit gamma/tau [Bacteroidaceae bacterium]|nr:DNA polymerase III subunit gamma/tau [Bacteroidaceae bacterium]